MCHKGSSGTAKLVVFYSDILILGVIGIVVLLGLPRMVGRLSRPYGWAQGFLLRSGNHQGPPSPMTEKQPSNDRISQTLPIIPNDNSEEGDRKTSRNNKGSALPPFHVPTWSTVLPSSVARVLRYSIVSGTSIGKTLIMLGYFAVMVFAGVYKAPLFTDPVQPGMVAMAQIPFVYVFATKNNVIGTLIGMGYDRLNWLHRYVGILVVLAANVHGVIYIQTFTQGGVWNECVQHGFIRWGVIALVCLDVLFFFSIPIWRRKAYNVFLASHLTASVLFLVAACLHQASMIPYVSTASALYGVDLLFRAIKTRTCRATLVAIPELDSTRIEVPRLKTGWRAGQHVRLRILSAKMGWWGWTEIHPLTIANASNSQGGLVLMCNNTGRWSRSLYAMAKMSEDQEGMSQTNSYVKVWLEGPYGGPGYTILESFSGAIFVTGGSGITLALSAVDELLSKKSQGTSRVQVIEMVWVVRHPASLTPLIPIFTSFLEQSNSLALNISVFYTRAVSPDYVIPILPAGFTLTAGRPKLARILDSVVDSLLSPGPGAQDPQDPARLSGVIVGVCGPSQLGHEVSNIIGDVDAKKGKMVGGVELYEELFGW